MFHFRYGFTRSLKNEIVKIVPWARVNVVAPGWVHTKMAEESVKLGHHFNALQTMPLRKIASTDDVGNAILVFSSGKVSGHSTGAIWESKILCDSVKIVKNSCS